MAGKEVIFSTSYAKASTRVSYNVYAQYEETVRGVAAEKEYVCKVHRFIKAIAAGCPPLRFAIADLNKLQKVNQQFGELRAVRDFSTASQEGYGILLRQVVGSLLHLTQVRAGMVHGILQTVRVVVGELPCMWLLMSTKARQVAWTH